MHPLTPPEGVLLDFIEQTRRLYIDMDRDYRRSADASGFVCNGCEDNCCRTLFYHHTYLEYITVRAGFAKLSRDRRELTQARAADYLRAVATGGGRLNQHPICPLNEAGRCILYGERPMICRLHGIEHGFTPPGREQQRLGPGCEDFYRQCGHTVHQRLDRTPHYLNLAKLEAQFKQGLGIHRKLKLTLADMVLKDLFGRRAGGTALLTPKEVDGRLR